jgi:8-oxo-dGTP diphosphatase
MPAYLEWLRRNVGHHLIPLVSATALIRDDAGRILFQHRADFRDAWWGLPGGLLEPGETPEACIQREVLEEVGLSVEVRRLTGVYSSPRYNVTYPNGDQVQQVTLCYECRIGGGSLNPDGREVLDLQFFDPKDLPPRPLWYADMLDHALNDLPTSYFDPPEQQPVNTPFSDLFSVRRVVGAAALVWPGASAGVLDEHGRILLQYRADIGVWALPAGSLHVGETLAQTAIRETEEETGLKVEPTRLLSIYAGSGFTYPNGDQLFPVAGLFACRVIAGELRADGHEALEVGFFAPDELPPIWPRMRARVQQVLAMGEITPPL